MSVSNMVIGGVVAVVAAIFFGVGYPSQFVFDPKVMHEIAQNAIRNTPDNNTTAIITSVVAQLRQRYPEYILESPEWMLNNAGGAMGSMLVLHCSFSEYVIIFGTAVGTEGHTGRFFAEDFFTILVGEQWAHTAGDVEGEVYAAGSQHYLPRGQAKQYRMPNACWALEYARGNIPSMMPFGLFDTFFSTLDFVTLYQTVKVSAVGMIGQLLNGKI